MTHAVVTIMVEPEHLGSEAAINTRIAELMAPYDECLRVAPYMVPCWCIDDENYGGTDGCEDCHGSGNAITTSNPLSKWDYYIPLEGKLCITVDDLPDKVTNAILSPEGGWQERGWMGWFGMFRNEDPDWPETFRSVYEINVGVGSRPFLRDYHI